MNTLTTNTQTLAAFDKTAESIVETLEELGFTSDFPIADLEEKIVGVLRQNLLGNTNYAVAQPSVPAGIPMDDLGYPRFISCESNKVKS